MVQYQYQYIGDKKLRVSIKPLNGTPQDANDTSKFLPQEITLYDKEFKYEFNAAIEKQCFKRRSEPSISSSSSSKTNTLNRHKKGQDPSVNRKDPVPVKKLLTISMAFFYSPDEIQTKNIIPFIYSENSNIDIDEIIRFCRQIKTDLKQLQIDKINSIRENQERFQEVLIQSVDRVILEAKLVQEIIQLNPQDQTNHFKSMMEYAFDLNQVFEWRGDTMLAAPSSENVEAKTVSTRDGRSQPTQPAAIANLVWGNIFIDGSDFLVNSLSSAAHSRYRIVADFLGGITKNSGALTLFFELTSGAFFAFYFNCFNETPFPLRDQLGVMKRLLLKYLELNNNLLEQLQPEEIDFLKKFFAIQRRGGTKIPFFTTTIQARFDEVLKKYKVLLPLSPQEGNIQNWQNWSIALMEAKIKNYLEKKNYQEISALMQQIKTDVEKNSQEVIKRIEIQVQKLINLTFEISSFVSKFRGTLLSHLIEASFEVKEQAVRQVISNSILILLTLIKRYSDIAKTFSNLENENAVLVAMRNFVTPEKSIEKKQVLQDVEFMLVGLLSNPHVDVRGLEEYFANELKDHESGQFRSVRNKRSGILEQLEVNCAIFSVFALPALIPAAPVAGGLIGVSTLSWALFSSVGPANTYMTSRGNTTTAKSLERMVSSDHINALRHYCRYLLAYEEFSKKKRPYSDYYFKHGKSLDHPFFEMDQGFSQSLKQNTITFQNDKLNVLNTRLYELYYKDDNGLVGIAGKFKKIQEKYIHLQSYSPEAQSIYKTDKDELMKDWKAAVNLVAKSRESKWLGQQNFGDIDEHQFRCFVAKQDFKTSDEAILRFYEIAAIIDMDTDAPRSKNKLTYFFRVIALAYEDSTSNWHVLHKHSHNKALSIEYAFRAMSAVFIWSIASKAVLLFLGALLFPIFGPVPLIVLGIAKFLLVMGLDAGRGIGYGLAKNYSAASDSAEHKASLENLSRDPGVLKNLYLQDPFEKLLAERVNKEALNLYLYNLKENILILNEQNTLNFNYEQEFIRQIGTLSQEIVDKFSAKVLFIKLVHSILYSNMNSYEKLRVMSNFANAFKNRTISLSQRLCRPRGTWGSRSIKHDGIFGAGAGLCTGVGVPALHIPAGAQLAMAAAGGDNISMTYNMVGGDRRGTTDNKTKSYENGLKILDFILEELGPKKTHTTANATLKQSALSRLSLPLPGFNFF